MMEEKEQQKPNFAAGDLFIFNFHSLLYSSNAPLLRISIGHGAGGGGGVSKPNAETITKSRMHSSLKRPRPIGAEHQKEEKGVKVPRPSALELQAVERRKQMMTMMTQTNKVDAPRRSMGKTTTDVRASLSDEHSTGGLSLLLLASCSFAALAKSLAPPAAAEKVRKVVSCVYVA